MRNTQPDSNLFSIEKGKCAKAPQKGSIGGQPGYPVWLLASAMRTTSNRPEANYLSKQFVVGSNNLEYPVIIDIQLPIEYDT